MEYGEGKLTLFALLLAIITNSNATINITYMQQTQRPMRCSSIDTYTNVSLIWCSQRCMEHHHYCEGFAVTKNVSATGYICEVCSVRSESSSIIQLSPASNLTKVYHHNVSWLSEQTGMTFILHNTVRSRYLVPDNSRKTPIARPLGRGMDVFREFKVFFYLRSCCSLCNTEIYRKSTVRCIFDRPMYIFKERINE